MEEKMSIYLRGKTWYYDFVYEGKRYYGSIGPDGPVNRRMAKEIETLKKREVIQGLYKPQIKIISFDKFKEQYLEWSKANKKPKSYIRDVCSLKQLSKFFGESSLSNINPFLIEKYKLIRKEEGAQPATINRELGCLRHCFNLAIKWGKAFKNPVQGVKFLKEPREKDRILTEEEEKRLFEVIKKSPKQKHLEPILITALNTGMRKSEILNLKWNQIDFGNRIITVENTKNGEIRKIPMNDLLTETLLKCKNESKSEYVFSENGKPYGDIKTGWWTALKKAGIEGLRFHDLRHTFGSRLGMAGVDLRTIQLLMGHKDIKMTMRYSHPTQQHIREAVQILQKNPINFPINGQSDKLSNVVNIRNY